MNLRKLEVRQAIFGWAMMRNDEVWNLFLLAQRVDKS